MTQTQWSQEGYIKAYKFAAAAHQGQTVPGPQGLPYIMHLSFVSMEVIASLAEERGRDENLAVQSALLHDILEDTATTYAQVAEQFGVAVADGVLALTKDATLPKTAQMADSLHRIRQQPPEIGMVKLADRITNLQAPPPHWTAEKIAQYHAEAITIHTALQDASPYLAARLQEKIKVYKTWTDGVKK